jgi:hypothetical protein
LGRVVNIIYASFKAIRDFLRVVFGRIPHRDYSTLLSLIIRLEVLQTACADYSANMHYPEYSIFPPCSLS